MATMSPVAAARAADNEHRARWGLGPVQLSPESAELLATHYEWEALRYEAAGFAAKAANAREQVAHYRAASKTEAA